MLTNIMYNVVQKGIYFLEWLPTDHPWLWSPIMANCEFGLKYFTQNLTRFAPFVVDRQVFPELNKHGLNVDKTLGKTHDANKADAKQMTNNKHDLNTNLIFWTKLSILRLSSRFNWTNQGSIWEWPIKPVITSTSPPLDKQWPFKTTRRPGVFGPVSPSACQARYT